MCYNQQLVRKAIGCGCNVSGTPGTPASSKQKDKNTQEHSHDYIHVRVHTWRRTEGNYQANGDSRFKLKTVISRLTFTGCGGLGLGLPAGVDARETPGKRPGTGTPNGK